jgi:hypothetical protein
VAPLKTKPSPPKLSEAARHLVYPSGIVTTGWPRIERRLVDMGVEFDPWQQGAARLILGKRKDGKYAATVGGVVWSIPRQVGKTFTIGSLLIAMCIEFPGFKVLWTAHRTRTATDAFRSMQGMVKRKRVRPHLAAGRNDGIRTANGEQEIAFRNGSSIMFGAREQGFGRGFTVIDVEVFDEAQILGLKALEDMVAATNQARHPHGALLFFLGTPPRPGDPSDAFTEKRRKALAGKPETHRCPADNLIYIELSADPKSDPDDRSQWPIMNPSHPLRTPTESLERLRENLPGDDSWNREGRGIWDESGPTGIFPPGAWASLGVKRRKKPKVAALGLAVDLDRVWLSVGASSAGEKPHLGAVNRVRLDKSRDQVVADVARIQRETNCLVALDAKGPAASLLPELNEAGVEVLRGSLDDYVQACSDIYDSVLAGTIEHGDYPELDDAVAAASWRPVGDRRVYGRKSGDVTMLEAVTWARWAAALGLAESEPSAFFL